MPLYSSDRNMKILLLSLLTIILSVAVKAQDVRKFEGEFGAAVPVTAKKFGSKFEPAWNFYAEGRYNLRNVPVDVGLQVQYGAFYRTWAATGIDRDFRFVTVLAVSDYNFRRGRNISPFVGVGAGMSFVRIEHSDLESINNSCDLSACVMPRVGIEFFRHVRFTVGYRLMNKEYSNLELSLGVVFGGGRRR